MRHLLTTTTVAIGERDWRITAIQDQDALLDIADTLPNFPYGFLLWESAIGLARMLADATELVAGRRVLELGAGVGVPGMVARSLGAEVWQTDHQAGALDVARANAEQNGVTGVNRFVADWRDWRHGERYDVLLGADILYERAMRFYLEHIFQHNLAPGGRLLLADPVRPQAMEFAADLEKRGWRMALETRRVQLYPELPDSRSIEVALITAERNT